MQVHRTSRNHKLQRTHAEVSFEETIGKLLSSIGKLGGVICIRSSNKEPTVALSTEMTVSILYTTFECLLFSTYVHSRAGCGE